MVVYDRDAIIQDADCIAVAKYIGMNPSSVVKGRRVFHPTKAIHVLCPNPEHDDRHLGSCFLTLNKEKGCYCHVCKKYYNLIDLVMLVTDQGYNRSMRTILTACDMDWRLYSTYCDKPDEAKKSVVKILSADELKFLGLKDEPIILEKTETDNLDECLDRNEYIVRGSKHYLICERIKGPISLMAEEEPELYAEFIIRHIYQAIQKRKDMIDKLRSGLIDVQQYCSVAALVKQYESDICRAEYLLADFGVKKAEKPKIQFHISVSAEESPFV